MAVQFGDDQEESTDVDISVNDEDTGGFEFIDRHIVYKRINLPSLVGEVQIKIDILPADRNHRPDCPGELYGGAQGGHQWLGNLLRASPQYHPPIEPNLNTFLQSVREQAGYINNLTEALEQQIRDMPAGETTVVPSGDGEKGDKGDKGDMGAPWVWH